MELAELIGISLPEFTQGLTVEELAQAKGLPEDFLRSLGVVDGFVGTGKNRRPCVDIPYVDENGEILGVRKRLSLDGHDRFMWRRGDHTNLYGLRSIQDIRNAGEVILVEGESDAWTLRLHSIPVLGLPGATTWKERFRHYLEGLVVYIWHELDGGGDELIREVCKDVPEVRIVEGPSGVKDPSDLYIQNPDHFEERLRSLMQSARPASDLQAEAFSREARENFKRADSLLNSPDILSVLADTIRAVGYAGDVRPALMSYVGVTSRLSDAPLNLAYISQSAAGKNAAIEATLPFFPKGAYYLVRASSPRALIYNDAQFAHRTVVLTEADSLPEEGPAASAMRSLISDHEMSYEVVEKQRDGSFYVRKIVKPGPTGLITTSTRSLGDQMDTRTLSVPIPDSVEQTRLILRAQADLANQALAPLDLSGWVALQRWLELAGERRVFIPFADALAELVPATAVRMRRDFPQILSVIQTVALLQQRLRERDSQGRVITTLDDYSKARWLLDEVVTATVHEGLTPAIRETVDAVARLALCGKTVTEQQLVRELRLARSTVHYRVRRAIRAGYLVNETSQRGAPAKLLPGAPLPAGCPLPEAAELAVCVEHPEEDSNPRTTPSRPATGQIDSVAPNGVRTGEEPTSDSSASELEAAQIGGSKGSKGIPRALHTQRPTKPVLRVRCHGIYS